MAKLVISFPPGTETSHDLGEEQITIGRVDDNTIQIDDASVSSHHAELSPEMGGYLVRDLSSTNGTRVNGENITERVIRDGDKVRFGQIEAVFQLGQTSGGEAPLPEMAEVENRPAQSSVRPDDFANASPFQTKGKSKDSLGSAVIGLAVLSILSFLGAVFIILTLQSGL